MDSGLFKVRLCPKDLSGFVRVHWIHENTLNLWNSGHESNPPIRIFKVWTRKSGFANL